MEMGDSEILYRTRIHMVELLKSGVENGVVG